MGGRGRALGFSVDRGSVDFATGKGRTETVESTLPAKVQAV
jgi:hypothetical protein